MKNDGGPAYPGEGWKLSYPIDMPQKWRDRLLVANQDSTGMSLRDYFAGQALGGMEIEVQSDLEYAAEEAYRIADAMLAAREATGQQENPDAQDKA